MNVQIENPVGIPSCRMYVFKYHLQTQQSPLLLFIVTFDGVVCSSRNCYLLLSFIKVFTINENIEGYKTGNAKKKKKNVHSKKYKRLVCTVKQILAELYLIYIKSYLVYYNLNIDFYFLLFFAHLHFVIAYMAYSPMEYS